MTWTKWAAIAAIILFLALAWPALMHQFAWWLAHDRKAELANMGTLGDSYGLLTSVFSGVTTLLLLFTIGKQMEAVQAQKDSVTLQQRLFDQQLTEEAKRSRHERTMWMVETYNSPMMRKARSQASTLIGSFGASPPTLTELEDQQHQYRMQRKRSKDESAYRAANEGMEEIASLFTVLFFYETWANLKTTGEIDQDMALGFFAPAARWYQDKYISLAVERKDDGWGHFLARLSREIGQPAAEYLRHRRGC